MPLLSIWASIFSGHTMNTEEPIASTKLTAPSPECDGIEKKRNFLFSFEIDAQMIDNCACKQMPFRAYDTCMLIHGTPR